MTDKHQTIPYPFRMTGAVRDYVTEIAKQNNRSLNNELLFRVERTIRWDEAEQSQPGNLLSAIQETVRHLEFLMTQLRIQKADEDFLASAKASAQSKKKPK